MLQSIFQFYKYILGFLLLSLVIFYPSLFGDFLNWDDGIYVVENPYIKSLSWESLKFIFTGYYMGNYHPVTMLSFLVDYQLFGPNPFYFHLINIIVHSLNSFLIFLLVKNLFQDRWLSIGSAVLFCSHPLHVESIAWISERKDLLYTCFFLLSIISFVKYRKERSRVWLVLTWINLLLSLLSKAQAVVLPVLFFITDLILLRPKYNTKFFVNYLGWFAVCGIIGLVAIDAQNEVHAISVTHHFTLLERIPLSGYAYFQYLIKFIAPINLSGLYMYPCTPNTFNPLLWIYVPVVGLFLVLISWINRKVNGVWWAVLFFSLAILPLLQILPVGDAIIADRYAYVPSIGLIIGLCLTLFKLKANHYKIAVGILFVVSAVLSFNRCSVWSNSTVFWTDIIAKYPKYGKAHNNLGNLMLKSGDTLNAIKSYQTAMALNYNMAYSNMAVIKVNQHQYDSALQLLNKAIKGNPRFASAYKNRAFVYHKKGNNKQSISDYQNCVKFSVNKTNCKNLLAEAYFKNGNYQEAISTIETIKTPSPAARLMIGKCWLKLHNFNKATKALSLLPDTYKNKLPALKVKAEILSQSGQSKDALKIYQQIEGVQGLDQHDLYNYANCLFMENRLNDAINFYLKCIEKGAIGTSLFNNLGLAYQKSNEFKQAHLYYSKACEVDSSFQDGHYNAGRLYSLERGYQNAVQSYSKVISLNPKHSAAYKFRGLALLKLDKKKEACLDYEKALKLGFKGDLSVLQKACLHPNTDN